jgi:hypothetical protein
MIREVISRSEGPRVGTTSPPPRKVKLNGRYRCAAEASWRKSKLRITTEYFLFGLLKFAFMPLSTLSVDYYLVAYLASLVLRTRERAFRADEVGGQRLSVVSHHARNLRSVGPIVRLARARTYYLRLTIIGDAGKPACQRHTSRNYEETETQNGANTIL